MTRKEAIPVVLVMFTIVSALPATMISPPSAIAQEDDDEAENLASDTVSNVLDNDNTAGDNTNTNTQLSVPLTDQDQTAANFGLNEALDVTVEETLSTPPAPPDDDDLPPEFVTFCFESETLVPFFLCFDTSEECSAAQEFHEASGTLIISECEGFETFPPRSVDCQFIEVEGEVTRIECGLPDPPTTTPTVFCYTVEFTSTVVSTHCFSTEDECGTGEEVITENGLARILSSCQGFETIPQGGQGCSVGSGFDPDTGRQVRFVSCP